MHNGPAKSYVRTNNGGFVHREVLKAAGLLTPDLEEAGYVVHHIDNNKRNNTIDNLLLLSNSEHVRLHHMLDREWSNHQDMSMEELTEFVIYKYNIRFI